MAPAVISALVLMLAGCEGDTGPMGPAGADGLTGPQGPAGENGENGENMILAYGQVDGTLATPTVSGIGPAGVTCSCTRFWTGHIDITVNGNFPIEEGLLLVSPTSGTGGNSLDDNLVYANVTTWTETQIVVCVESQDNSGTQEDTDFAFVLMKF
jgi:hypothetical protein